MSHVTGVILTGSGIAVLLSTLWLDGRVPV